MFSFGLFAMPKFFSLYFRKYLFYDGYIFLCGPKQQWKNMMKPYRAVISLVYLSSIIATVVIGIVLSDSFIVVFILAACQFCAMVWYALSYIPFRRKFCGTCLKSCCCGQNEGGYTEE